MVDTSRFPILFRAILTALAIAACAPSGHDGGAAWAQNRDPGMRGPGGRQGPTDEQREQMRRQMQQQMQQKLEQQPQGQTQGQPQQQQTPSAQPTPGQQAPAPMMRQETAAGADELLDQALLADPARREQAKAKAAQSPPAGADDSALAQFYFDRAKEADIAGLAAQFNRDLRLAAQHGEKVKTSLLMSIYNQLAQSEQQAGRMAAAVRYLNQAIEYIPRMQAGRRVSFYGLLGRYAVQAGDIPGAENALAKAKDAYVDAQVSVQSGRANVPQANMLAIEAHLLCVQSGVYGLRGQYAAAEDLQRRCLATAEQTPMFNDSPFIGMRYFDLARLAMLQGRLGDSENEARTGLVWLQRMRGASGVLVANGLSMLSVVLTEQGRSAEAEQLGRKAIDLVQASGERAQGGIRMNLANTLAAQGKWAEAEKEIPGFLKNLSEDPQAALNALNRNPWPPLILIKIGKTAEATKYLNDLVSLRAKALGERHFSTAEARGQLGIALLESGKREEARKAFADAVPVLLQRSRETDDDAGIAARDQRVRLILEAYMRYLFETKTPQAGAEAFRLAEAARGRTVERALAASAARMAADNPQLADLARKEQDLQQQISGLNSLLANAISAKAEDQNAEAIKNLRAQIDGMRDQRARTAEEIEKRFPDYASLVNPRPATVESAQKSLKPGEALLSTYSAEDATYAWAVPQQGAPALAQWKISRDALAKTVAALRKALDPDAIETLNDVPVFDVASAHQVYANLLAPTEAGWGQAKSLVVVPHGALAQLPFALLPTQAAQVEKTALPFQGYAAVPWLARKVAVAQLPSVASLATLRALPAADAKRQPFVGFADPWFNAQQAAEGKRTQTAAIATRGLARRSAPKSAEAQAAEFKTLPRLPDTADEVRSIAQALKSDAKSLYLGAEANKGAVRKAKLDAYRVVMFATHGLVAGEITGLSQPALALSGPEVAPEGGNGLLTMEEILSLKLDADWVVLSACNTTTGQGAGSEAVSGLGRAFFYAGTRALLVSNWPVETVSARILTTDLFRRQAEGGGVARAEALRQAMMALVDGPGAVDSATKKPAYSYAHPIFWAAFALVGDGGA
jgi:CHAT domain-containing protein